MKDMSKTMRKRMARKKFLQCLARTVAIEGRGQKLCWRGYVLEREKNY